MAPPMGRRDYVLWTPEEIEAIWADARKHTLAERDVQRRRALGLPSIIRCWRCDRSFGTSYMRFMWHAAFCRWTNRHSHKEH